MILAGIVMTLIVAAKYDLKQVDYNCGSPLSGSSVNQSPPKRQQRVDQNLLHSSAKMRVFGALPTVREPVFHGQLSGTAASVILL